MSVINRSAIERSRAAALDATKERNAASGCWSVTRPADGGETDPETGDWTPGTEPVWEGPAHFSTTERPSIARRADTALTVQGPQLCVVGCATALEVGDTVVPVTVADASLLGRTWRIVGEPGSSHGIHRHYPLEEVTSVRVVR